MIEFFASTSPLVLMGIFVLMAVSLYLSHKDKTNKFNWTDLIVSSTSGKANLPKFLQLVGALTATWIVIHQELTLRLSAEIFGLYLITLAGAEGYSRYVAYKNSKKLDNQEVENANNQS